MRQYNEHASEIKLNDDPNETPEQPTTNFREHKFRSVERTKRHRGDYGLKET
jgi:hypothetical protein